MRRYYEFALAITIISVCAVLAMRALSDVERDAEEARMQAEFMAIRAQLLEVVVHRETFGGQLPASENPMDWVAERPSAYRGACAAACDGRGIWYFDMAMKELVYRFQDGHAARFRLVRRAGSEGMRGLPGGLNLQRLDEGAPR